MGKISDGHNREVQSSEHWLSLRQLRLMADEREKNLEGLSPQVQEMVRHTKYKIDHGTDPQIGFKDAVERAEMTGMDMETVERRTDAAAILWDHYEIDVNPVNIENNTKDETP